MYSKKFILLLILVFLILFIGIVSIIVASNFNRNLLIYKDQLKLLQYMDLSSDHATLIFNNKSMGKNILNSDDVKKILFYMTKVSGTADIPNKNYDIRIAFPKNEILIYFLDENTAIIDAKLPSKEYKLKIKHHGLKKSIEEIYKNNAPK